MATIDAAAAGISFGAPAFLVCLWRLVSWQCRYFFAAQQSTTVALPELRDATAGCTSGFFECPSLLSECMLFLSEHPLPDVAICKISMPVLPVLWEGWLGFCWRQQEGWLGFWLCSATINLCDDSVTMWHHLWFISQLWNDLCYVDTFAVGKVNLFKWALLATSNNGATINLCHANRSSDGHGDRSSDNCFDHTAFRSQK